MDNRQFEDFDDRMMREACTGCAGAIVFWFVLVILMLCFASCKNIKYVPVMTTRTDTCYITKHQRDSIWQHDSIFLHELQKGDTVFVLHERWHTKYVSNEVHDTTYIATHDTIPQPYPVLEYIEKELSWWEKTKMNMGLLMLGLLAIVVIVGLYKLYKIFRP